MVNYTGEDFTRHVLVIKLKSYIFLYNFFTVMHVFYEKPLTDFFVHLYPLTWRNVCGINFNKDS